MQVKCLNKSENRGNKIGTSELCFFSFFFLGGDENQGGIKPPKVTTCYLHGVSNGSWQKKSRNQFEPLASHLLWQAKQNKINSQRKKPFCLAMLLSRKIRISNSIFTIDEIGHTVNSGWGKKKTEPERPALICSPTSSLYREKRGPKRVSDLPGNTQGVRNQLRLTSQPSASSPVMLPPLHYCLCRREEKYTHRTSGIFMCASTPI